MGLTALLLMGIFALLAQTVEVRANGTETLGNPTGITIQKGTGIVSGGTGLVTQPGTIIVNVPFGATVKQVLLYWEGISNSVNNTNCNGVTGDASIVIDANAVQGVKIGGPTFIPAPKTCIFSFRADITNLDLVEAGPNSFDVSGLQFNRSNSGAGIIVIFDQGVGATFSGEATVVDATVNLLLLQLNVTEVTAGPLAPEGGSESDTVNDLVVAGLLTSETATASTTGAGNQSLSEALVEGLGLNLLNLLTLDASIIRAEAQATCDETGDAIVSGDSEILDLEVNGQPVNLVIPPFNVLGLGLVSIVTNEQIVNDTGSFAEITVNALHITVSALGNTVVDIVISSAHADIECEVTDPAQIPIGIKDGSDFAIKNFPAPLNATVRQAFNFTAATFDRTANVTLFVADCDADRPDIIRIRTLSLGPTIVLTNNAFADRCSSSDGFSWDTLTIPVEIPAGAERLDVQLFSQKAGTSKLTGTPDSLIWVLAAIAGPTADGITFSGRATVARASLLNIDTLVVGDTGDLPPSGGTLEEPGVVVNLPPVISSGTGSAKTMGAGNTSSSEAKVEDLIGLNILNAITGSADVLQATASAECDNGNASVTGNSVITNLTLNVLNLPQINVLIAPLPNTVLLNVNVPLLGLVRIVANEQIKSPPNGTADITVNALHITIGQGGNLGDIADIVIAHAHADIACN